MTKLVTTLTLALFALGCAASSSGPREATGEAGTEARRIQYRGFSVAAPRSKGWELRESEQTPVRALFRKPLESKTHSVLVQVELLPMQITGDESAEQLGERVLESRFVDPARFERKKFEPEADASWGERCLGYRLEVLDKKAPISPDETLEIVEQGFACPHPALKGVLLTGVASERGKADELDGDLRAEGVDFLRGVRAERVEIQPEGEAPAPGAPEAAPASGEISPPAP
jgi:hypothetical protein